LLIKLILYNIINPHSSMFVSVILNDSSTFVTGTIMRKMIDITYYNDHGSIRFILL